VPFAWGETATVSSSTPPRDYGTMLSLQSPPPPTNIFSYKAPTNLSASTGSCSSNAHSKRHICSGCLTIHPWSPELPSSSGGCNQSCHIDFQPGKQNYALSTYLLNIRTYYEAFKMVSTLIFPASTLHKHHLIVHLPPFSSTLSSPFLPMNSVPNAISAPSLFKLCNRYSALFNLHPYPSFRNPANQENSALSRTFPSPLSRC
jgi:hypothetical protein